MQTILGSGGAIGIPLAKELKKYTNKIRLVSRNPKKVNDTDELYPMDVNDLTQIDKAIAGSEVVYVVIGFPYKLSVWQNIWPRFLKEVINACIKYNAKLVFFDNVYMYDKSAIPFMTETSPVHAPSKKGAIRQQLHEMIMHEVEKKTLTALIARAADFYGPDNKNSVLNMLVVDNLSKGKKAQVLGDLNKVHTYTYTPDAAKATALLGNTIDAYNQVWHVPTTKEKITNLQWIQLIADELKVEVKIQAVPMWLIKMLGLFIPVMKELPEMNYQNEQDYIFDSTKFEKRFGIEATTPKDGIRILVESLKRAGR
ncbi:NAD-dependent epimerase/dehydratase family protein [Chryseosolibacter indicus]|uniref:NAD-dependent epimerase/dehydratase family protein n=1 Tax=Chryseosolibacter indicus TaxID=2782351 RepID=A0ABS5VLI3_9BACT|nr:NAD-dependent epimerase/dehydratase family protein [Chryseosolibacter indicus]MBT1702313.1 NAD-dependent epimerase/dehydratase family protein [Chryseosolibacter indicus]